MVLKLVFSLDVPDVSLKLVEVWSQGLDVFGRPAHPSENGPVVGRHEYGQVVLRVDSEVIAAVNRELYPLQLLVPVRPNVEELQLVDPCLTHARHKKLLTLVEQTGRGGHRVSSIVQLRLAITYASGLQLVIIELILVHDHDVRVEFDEGAVLPLSAVDHIFDVLLKVDHPRKLIVLLGVLGCSIVKVVQAESSV